MTEMQFFVCVETTKPHRNESAIFIKRNCNRVNQNNHVIFSPFCGGIGGWAHAARFMTKHGYPFTCPLAMDISREAAVSYSQSHGLTLVNQPLQAVHLRRPCVLVGDVLQPSPWMGASILNTDIVTISWPCVTFSSAGLQKGWSEETREMFRFTVQQSNLIGANFLLLENVPPVWTDWAWRSTLFAELADQHFELIFADVISTKAVVPADRSRFIGVAIKKNMRVLWDGQKKKEVMRAFHGICKNLGSEGMWFDQIPQQLACQVHLRDDELQLYACPRRSPRYVRSQEQALELRLVSDEGSMPATTIMRSYSQQRLFHEVQTGSAKILGNLRLGQDNRPRLFSHPEILTAMGFTNGIDSPVNLKQGCAETGNAIMQIHAMAAFWVVIENEDLQTIGDFQDFDQCVRAFQACRHKATGDIQFRDDRCIIGFDADDPTLPRAQFEAVVRIQYHEVRRLVRCPLGLTIRQFLEWGDVQFWRKTFQISGARGL